MADNPRERHMERWIQVRVADGLFPSERTVYLPTVDGDLSLFVSKTQVDEARQALRVIVLDQNDEFLLLQVPAQGSSTVAKMRRAAVRFAAG